MKIKTRLSLQFTLTVSGILLFFSLLVYYFSYSTQLAKFRQNLLDSAKNTSTLLINVAEVDSTLLKKIQQSTISWEQEELVITDSAFNLVYSNNIRYLSNNSTLINHAGGVIRYFSIAHKDGVYYRHVYENRKYNVFIMAFDKSRAENLTGLQKILFWSILFSIWLSVLLSYIFAKRAIKPISRIVSNVKEINSLKLSSRLDEGNGKDEIDQLSITFNKMLSDLEIAFKNQEDFVSNASHELRTPLTVMIGENDYFLSHERSKEEYINHLAGLSNDLKKLNSLINSLLELAQINKDKNIVFSKLRIDELIFNVIHQIRSKYQGRKIVPKIQYPDNGNELLIYGNPGMLEIALLNLLDNACKFSTDEVGIEFMIYDEFISVVVSDKGIGIPPDDIGNICKPFKRASNVKFIGGFGIGLSLVSKIMELHEAGMKVKSDLKEGTRVEILFKRYSG
jgi:signal transduction histidine kinase